MMDAIPFDMTGRDWMIAGRIRAAIRSHREHLNSQDRLGRTSDTLAVPAASPLVNQSRQDTTV